MENIISKLKELNNKQKVIVAIISFAIVIIAFIILYKFFYSEDVELLNENGLVENELEENKVVESKIGILESKKTVTVHVIGEVNSPGVVTLEEGARIIDAINAAGGKTEEADLSKINLAYVIEDGIQIYIPSIMEVAQTENQIEYIREGAGEEIITNAATQENQKEKETKVNINTANEEKLQTLPGVGESTAQKIIEYREQNGKFQSIEDLKNVSGIGDNKFNNLKDKIVV